MRTLSIKLLILIPLFITCGNEQKERPKTTEELRTELKGKELLNPKAYLQDKDVTLKLQKKEIRKANLFRSAKYADDGGLISGFFVNKSTLATYKDIEVRVSYYSQTKTLIYKKKHIFYNFYKPNESEYFTLKVYPPKAYKTFSFVITDAKGVFN